MTITLKDLIEKKVKEASLYAQGKAEYAQEQEDEENEDDDQTADPDDTDSEDSDDSDDPKNKKKVAEALFGRHKLEDVMEATLSERSEYAQARAGEEEWRRGAASGPTSITGKFKLKHPAGHFISGHATENEAMNAWKNLKDNKGVKIVREGVEYNIMESSDSASGYVLVECITESTKVKPFSTNHIAKLKSEYSKLKSIDPSSDTYKQLTGKLNAMHNDHLVQLQDAGIPFISGLARNRVRTRSAVTASVAECANSDACKAHAVKSGARSPSGVGVFNDVDAAFAHADRQEKAAVVMKHPDFNSHVVVGMRDAADMEDNGYKFVSRKA